MDDPCTTLRAYERATAVALACIGDAAIGSPALRAKHVVSNLATAVSIVTHALAVADDRHLGLLKRRGLAAARAQRPPPCDPAGRSLRHVAAWQAHRLHATVQSHWTLQLQEPEVHFQGAVVVIRVLDDLRSVAVLLVAAGLPGAPLASNHVQATLPSQAMGSGENPIRTDQHSAAPRRSSRAVAESHLMGPFALVGRLPVHDRNARVTVPVLRHTSCAHNGRKHR